MPLALIVAPLAAIGNGIAETRPQSLGIGGGIAALIIGWMVVSMAT